MRHNFCAYSHLPSWCALNTTCNLAALPSCHILVTVPHSGNCLSRYSDFNLREFPNTVSFLGTAEEIVCLILLGSHLSNLTQVSPYIHLYSILQDAINRMLTTKIFQVGAFYSSLHYQLGQGLCGTRRIRYPLQFFCEDQPTLSLTTLNIAAHPARMARANE